jgi:hypothetical protein
LGVGAPPPNPQSPIPNPQSPIPNEYKYIILLNIDIFIFFILILVKMINNLIFIIKMEYSLNPIDINVRNEIQIIK